MAKKMHPALTHRIVMADNHWGKGATYEEAKRAYRKARGKVFPENSPGKFAVFATTESTVVGELGGFIRAGIDPAPIDITSAKPLW